MVDEIIDSVIQSNNRQPSVPGVVLDAIKDVIDTEPTTFEDKSQAGGDSKQTQLLIDDIAARARAPTREDEETQEVVMVMEEEDEERERERQTPESDTLANGHVVVSSKESTPDSAGDREKDSVTRSASQKGIYEKTKDKKAELEGKKSSAEDKAVLRKKEEEQNSETTLSRQVRRWF